MSKKKILTDYSNEELMQSYLAVQSHCNNSYDIEQFFTNALAAGCIDEKSFLAYRRYLRDLSDCICDVLDNRTLCEQRHKIDNLIEETKK